MKFLLFLIVAAACNSFYKVQAELASERYRQKSTQKTDDNKPLIDILMHLAKTKQLNNGKNRESALKLMKKLKLQKGPKERRLSLKHYQKHYQNRKQYRK